TIYRDVFKLARWRKPVKQAIVSTTVPVTESLFKLDL
ncbi:jg845, partial [Pararge aegeria aegeria]